jgi:hypothetical protein
VHEEGVIDRLFLHHVQGVAVLGGEGRGEGEEDEEGQTRTYCAAGILCYRALAPSGLLKEVVSNIHSHIGLSLFTIIIT